VSVKDCPRCGLANPPLAARCDCGFRFAATALTTSKPQAPVAMKPPPEGTATFVYPPVFLPLAVVLSALFLWGFYRIITDPTVLSPKGLLAFAIGIVGTSAILVLVLKSWQTYWRFTLTPTHFIAEHRVGRRRIEAAWDDIAEVRRVVQPWWARWVVRGHSEVTTVRGEEATIGPDLPDYEDFIDILRARAVKVRAFDPYYGEVKSW
jgi:hypothetical protein